MPDDANWFGVAREIVEPKTVAFADRDSLFAAEMAKLPVFPETNLERWRDHAAESPPTEYDAADWNTVQRMSRDARRQARRDEP